MTVSQNSSKGLIACEEALLRLLNGKPIVAGHVGLDLSKLTASVVSLEAGFDRGYLKKSRVAHLPILAKIEASRAGANRGTGSSNAKKIMRLQQQLVFLENELALVQSQRDRTLTQNMQLWERVRGLEQSARQQKSNVVLHQ